MAFLFDSHPSVEKENRTTFIHLLHFLDSIYIYTLIQVSLRKMVLRIEVPNSETPKRKK